MHSRLRCHFGKAAAAGLLVLVGVTGCSTEQRETTPESAESAQSDYTAKQARQDPIDFVTATTELLGSDNWESTSGTPWPGTCTLPNGEDGTYYSYSLRTDQRPDDVQADVQKIVDHWESLGVSTRIVDHGEYPTVYATGGPVVRASFSSKIPGADKYEVGAVGGCAPGDSLELMQVENDRAEQREVIPGDSYFYNHPPEDAEADDVDVNDQASEQADYNRSDRFLPGLVRELKPEPVAQVLEPMFSRIDS